MTFPNPKRIIFINQDSGYLMIDIINAYVKAGYKCVLFTGRLVERNNKLHESVLIEWIIKYKRTTTFKRLLTWGIGFVQILLKTVFRYRKDCLFIVTNPPIAPLLPLVLKNSFDLLVFDIYPDVLTELGYLPEDSMIIKWWRKANRMVFTKALHIFTISDAMKQVLKKYTGNDGITVVPLWTDNNFLKPVSPSKNPFINKHNLTGKFVVLYSGNIGLSSDVDVLIEVAKGIERDDIVFLIIGEGAKKELVKNKIKEQNVRNVRMLPWQHPDDLPSSFSSASLAVISHGSGVSRLAIPSKLYNFLSVGAPLLCITSKGSEVESMVTKYACGKCFEPSDIIEMIKFIINAADNNIMHNSMSNNSLNASKDFSPSNVASFLQ